MKEWKPSEPSEPSEPIASVEGIVYNGQFLPHVSCILKVTASKEEMKRLKKWEKKMLEVWGNKAKGEVIRGQRLNAGKAAHQIIAQLLKVERLKISDKLNEIEKEMKEAGDVQGLEGISYVRPALPYLNFNMGRILEIETAVTTSKYCGTYDARTKTGIIDWKTADNIKTRKWMAQGFLQATAYALAVNEQTMKTITLVILRKDGIQVMEEKVEDWKSQWEEKVEEFVEYCELNRPNLVGRNGETFPQSTAYW